MIKGDRNDKKSEIIKWIASRGSSHSVQFGLSLRLKNISKSNSRVYSDIFFFKISKLLPIVSGSIPCSSFRWLSIMLLIAYVPPFDDAGVDSWTNIVCITKTTLVMIHTVIFVDSQLEVYVPLVWIVLWSSDLCKQAEQQHQSFDWYHWCKVYKLWNNSYLKCGFRWGPP